MAHELAHIKNRDTLTMTITATIAGAISMLAQFGLFFSGNRSNNGMGLIGTLAMVILAPIAEEVFFRGVVFNAFVREGGRRWAFIGSAALFSLMPTPSARLDRWLEEHPRLFRRVVVPAESVTSTSSPTAAARRGNSAPRPCSRGERTTSNSRST